MQLVQKHGAFIIGALVSIGIVIWSSGFPFFWDTIQLGSKHANWYYSQGFAQFLLPDQIDSGHFPFFGLLLGFVWTCFGKSLVVSHFLMLPFLLMIVHYTLKIGEVLTDEKYKFYFLLLVFCNPYFLGQAVLVSPDIVLLAFFSMWLSGYLYQKNIIILLATIGLSLISMRGLLIVVVLLLWDLYQKRYLKKHNFDLVCLLPGVGLGLAYQLFHYLQKGWVIFHDESPWAASFDSVYEVDNVLWNSGIYIWRLIDFGNAFLWITLLVLVVHGKGRKSILFRLLLLCTIVFALVTIPKSGLLNHRYYLPIIFLLICTLLDLLYKSSLSYKKPIIAVLFTLTMTGNLWIYPEGTAQGWDSTLAHVPYYRLLDNAIQYLNSNEINIEEVGTGFPATNKLSDLYLNDDHRSFKSFDLDRDEYILFSNVMNEFDSEHNFELDNLWKPIFLEEKAGVLVVIYQKK